MSQKIVQPDGGAENSPAPTMDLTVRALPVSVNDADRTLLPAILDAIVSHAADSPGQGLILASPGLEIPPATIDLLAQAASQSGPADVLTLFSNADPDVNPYAGIDAEPLSSVDLAALIALLGPGELHPLHRVPTHCLVFPPATLEMLAASTREFGDSPPSLLDILEHQGGRVLVHDRLFVHDPSAPLNAAPRLEAHEEDRRAPWGLLIQRLDDWLSQPGRPAASTDLVSNYTDSARVAAGTCLHVTHSWGGGVARWVDSFIEADPGRLHLQLRSEGPRSGHGAGQRLALYAATQDETPLASWWLEPVIASTTTHHPQVREILAYIVARYGVSEVIVSSLVGHSLDVLRIDRPTIEVLHDFYPAWPLLGIHPQPYLGADGAALASAMKEHPLLPDFRGRGPHAWKRLGAEWRETLRDRGVNLVAPSRSVADLMPRLDSGFAGLEPQIIPHGLGDDWARPEWPLCPREDGRLRVLVPGRLQRGKGKALLLKALDELRPLARITLLGCGKDGEDFFGLSDVDVVMSFDREQLPGEIARMAPDVAALLSTVPETFGYMLSEMRQLGVPVIATRVGSFAERVEDGVDGWLIDPTPEALIGKIASLASDRDKIAAMHQALRTAPRRTAFDMVADYRELFPRHEESSRQQSVLEFPARAQAGSLASTAVGQARTIRRIKQQLEESRREVENRTRWAREREHALEEEQKEKLAWVKQLEARIERGLKALRSEEEAHQLTRDILEELRTVHESVLASSSWRITRPLRVARRLGANLVRTRAWNPLRWPLLLSQFVRTLRTLGLRGTIMRLQNVQVSHAPPSIQSHLLEAVGDPQPPAVMPRADHPLVTIVIPVHNQWIYTAACLRSIAAAECRAGFEVIVIDDASSDDTQDMLAAVNGIDAVTNRKNLGFIGSCNRGAALANGEFVVFLNNDTQVMDGWLDHLLSTFRLFPDTGIAGARLIYPDGSLQECGGIIFQDGSGWNYGRGDNPDRPEYHYVREVDYCSGACIMLRRKVFGDLEGFDSHYAPAYYEDTDLAFRVREQGLKVRVQPAATVIHHEGITSGTDLASGAKRYQAVNHRKFLQRWQQQLSAHPIPMVDPNDRNEIRRACDHRLKGRVLIIDAYTPEPDQDSGSLRLRYLMDCLFDLGYGVTFLPDNRSHAGRYTEALQQAGVEALYEPWLDSLHSWFNANGERLDFVIACRHYVANNYVNLVRRYAPQAKFLFDTIDLHFVREERLAELENSLPLRRSAEQTKRSELAVIGEADATLVVSPTEIEILRVEAPDARVHLLSNIHRVSGSKNPFNARRDLFFVGGFQHPPNIDAAQWFCGSVWPLIRAQLPEAEFHLIGSKAPEQIKALAGNGVVFHGFVPRLEPFLDGCRLAVAPLRYGAGVKGKVNLSMSRGQPVVATPAAVEGLFARDGEDILVAEDAQAFADAVVRLYNDEALWNRLSENGLRNVEQYFSLETARKNLAAILDSFE